MKSFSRGTLGLMADYRIGPFQVETGAERLKTVFGAASLIGLGEPLLTGLARWGSPNTLHRAIRLWAKTTARFLDLRLEPSGLDHVDPEQTYVVAPLHEGFADALLLARLPLQLRYLARDELFEWRRLGRFLRASGQSEVATGTGGRDLRRVVTAVGDLLDQGQSLVIFPQGSILGIEVAFSRGAFLLADRFSRPLLPVVVTGTHRVWEHPYSPTLRYGQPVSMQVLPPIPPGMALATFNEIEREMKRVALANRHAPVRHFDPKHDGYWDGYSYEIDPEFPEIAALVEQHRQSPKPVDRI